MVERKPIVILELLRVTAQLRKAIENNEEELVDRYWEEREFLFRELERMDRMLNGRPHPQDEEMLKMLNQLKKQDEGLAALLEKGRGMILEEVLHTSKMRIQILSEAMVDTKGGSLSIKA